MHIGSLVAARTGDSDADIFAWQWIYLLSKLAPKDMEPEYLRPEGIGFDHRNDLVQEDVNTFLDTCFPWVPRDKAEFTLNGTEYVFFRIRFWCPPLINTTHPTIPTDPTDPTNFTYLPYLPYLPDEPTNLTCLCQVDVGAAAHLQCHERVVEWCAHVYSGEADVLLLRGAEGYAQLHPVPQRSA
jgi:hypothetical protein